MKTLLLTIGTGSSTDLEATLLSPLRKSMHQGAWARIVLLPSHITTATANLLKNGLSDLPIEVRPLAAPGDEDNADVCAQHFSDVIAALEHEGIRPAEIVADFTRGTKAMSAALVLAAVRHGVPVLRYITGARDQRGMVVPGQERIKEVATSLATAGRLLDMAHLYIRRGMFAAAMQIIPENEQVRRLFFPERFCATADWVRRFAHFLSAWDRLDYLAAVAASGDLEAHSTVPESWLNLAPSREILKHVRALSRPMPVDQAARAAQLRLLAIDLFSNGERRLRDRQYEDALVRAYRVLEMVTQCRLLDAGCDPQNLDGNNPAIRQAENIAHRPFRRRDGKLQADRDQMLWLLKALGHDEFDSLRTLHTIIARRNDSILTHGYMAAAPRLTRDMNTLYKEILVVLGGESQELTRSRFLHFY